MESGSQPSAPNVTEPPSSASPPSESPAKQPAAELKLGDRIEVLWTIERDEDETGETAERDEQRWWGASVKEVWKTPGSAYTVLYDAYAEFEPAEVEVTLVGSRLLEDASVGGARMVWRREGDLSVSAPGGEPGRDGVETGGDVCSMRDVVKAQEEVDAEDGVNSGAEMMAALGQLPATQQADLGIMYREFADEVKTQLGRLMTQQGPGYVVTQQNIADIMVKIQSEKRGKGNTQA